MALTPLFFDVVNKKLVRSETDPGEFHLPELHQEDGMEIELTVLKRINTGRPFFEKVNISGYDLEISIGTAGTVNAGQTSWSVINSGTTFSGEVDLSTNEIDELSDATPQLVEIKLSNGSVSHRAQFLTTIRKSVKTSGSLNPVVNDTAIGVLQAKRLFVKKEMGPGEGIIWQAPGGRKWLEYIGDDGLKQFTEII